MKKAQIASTDIIIALVIFVVAGAIFFSLLVGKSANDTSARLDREGDVLVTDLVTATPGDATDISLASSGTLNRNSVEDFVYKETSDPLFYAEVKAELGIKGDYCVHFETENGSIIYLHQLLRDNPTLAEEFLKSGIALSDVDEVDDISSFGVGSDRILINGLPCKNSN